MRTDLKVNYDALLDLADHLKEYQNDAEVVERSLNNMKGFLNKQNSKSIEKLNEKINAEDEYFLTLIDSLKDLRKKIKSYVDSMEGYVEAEHSGEITRVDVLDIKSNLKSMKRSVENNNDWFERSLPGGSYTFTGKKKEQENQKKKYERNYDKIEDYRRNNIAPLSKNLEQGIKELYKIYDKYIEPFENEDDRHRKRLDKSYKEYTSIKNKIKNSVNFYLRIRNSLHKHMYAAMAIAAAVALFPEAAIIAAIAAVAAGAAIAAIPEKYFGNKLLKRIKASADEKVKIVKQGPAKVLKVIINDIADTVQTPEGIAGVVGDVIGVYAGGKIARAIRTSYEAPKKVDSEVPVEEVKKPEEVNAENTIKVTDGLDEEKIDDYLKKAINNSDSDTVALGNTGTYDILAEKEGYTYFKMSDDAWNMLEKDTSYNYDEIWKVNKKFLDEQIKQNKKIILTADPDKGYYLPDGQKRFFQREIDYLKSLGYEFVKIKEGIWEAVKKGD